MKNVFKWGFLVVFLVSYQTADAQILKKLKNKIEKKAEEVGNKLEAKAENKVDKKVDEVLNKERKKKKKKNRDESENSSETSTENEENTKNNSGSVTITHSNTFGAVTIPEVSKIKVNRSNTLYEISSSWWSHEADIHDGFVLRIKDSIDLRHDTNTDENVKRTFKIPEEATLKLSYDPTLPYYKEAVNNFKQAVTNDYQSYDVSSGEVTIDVLSANAIQISFNGKVTLKKLTAIPNSDDEYSETYFEASVIGGIDSKDVTYFDNMSTVIKKKDEAVTYNNDHANLPEAKAGVYQFTFETEVEVTTSDQERPYKMSYLLNPSEKYVGLKANMADYSEEEMQGESIIVMDDGNAHIFVNTQGMKMQMSQNMMGNNQQSNPTAQMENYDYANLEKTGNTKTILGATCYEYTMSDKDVKMNLWVAPEVNLPNWFVQNQEVLKGHIMEYTVTSKDGVSKSTIIAINDNINKTINPKDYKKMF